MLLDGEEHDAIQLAGMSFRILGYSWPDAGDYWDRNWLNIQADVSAPGAHVQVNGACLRTDELSTFEEQLAALYRDLRGTASLSCLEPNLSVQVCCNSLGHVEIVIKVTPDHLRQSHRFIFAVDQSYLENALRGLRHILEIYPVKGKETS